MAGLFGDQLSAVSYRLIPFGSLFMFPFQVRSSQFTIHDSHFPFHYSFIIFILSPVPQSVSLRDHRRLIVMKKIVKKHPLAIRWFHWINFPVLAIMIWSGLLIYWANDIYKIKFGNTTIINFFPKGFYKALNVPFHLAKGMSFHFAFAWLFVINGIL